MWIAMIVLIAVVLMFVLEYGNRRDNDWFDGDDN